MAIAQQLAAVLFLSDDPETREEVAAVLEGAQYRVIQVAREEAEACALERPVDVILLDLSEQDVAEEMARRLKAVCLAPFIPLLRLTAEEEEARPLVESLEANSYAVLAKPVVPQVLLAMVNTLARLGRAYREMHQERTRLEEVLAQMPSGVIIADAEGQLQVTNERAREILCLPEVPPSQEERVRSLQPAQQGVLTGIENWPLRRALRTGERVIGEEFEITCGDGRTIVARVSAGPIRSPEGEVIAGALTFTDITDRKQVEGELEQQARLLDTLIERTDVWFAYLDRDLRFVWANAAYARAVGVDRQGMVGRLFADVFPASADLQRWLEQARDTGEPVRLHAIPQRMEHRAKPARRSLDLAVLPVKDSSGDLRGLVLSAVDVTLQIRARTQLLAAQQARAEQAEVLNAQIERQRALLEGIQENTSAGILYLDLDYLVQYANAAVEQQTRIPREAILHQRFFDFFPNEEVQALFALARATGEPVQGDEVPFVFPGQPERGVTYWSGTIAPLNDDQGQPSGFVLTLIEVTEQVRQRGQLQGQRALLETVLENIRSRVAYYTPDFVIRIANQAYADSVGVRREELVGRDYFTVFPNAKVEAIFRHVVETGEAFEVAEMPYVVAGRPELGTLYFRWRLVPLLGPHGEVEGLVSSSLDITEEVQRREQLLAAERSRAELAETLNAEVNHRVKNNLAMAAGLLQLQSFEETDERVNTVLKDAASRLLALAQVHEQLQVSAEGRVDLLAGIQRLTDATREALATRGVDFVVEGQPVELAAQAATNMLIVANELITNAAKYCQPTGGGNCAVTVGVRVGLAVHEGKLVLSVWNSGNPVPEGFGPASARGMGLRLVWALIVDQCHGTFSLRPHEGGTLAEATVDLNQLGLHCGA